MKYRDGDDDSQVRKAKQGIKIRREQRQLELDKATDCSWRRGTGHRYWIPRRSRRSSASLAR